MGNKTIFLKEGEPYITLNILLKLAGVISTGGQAKFYLQENDVYVNQESEPERRRGRKLYANDSVLINKTVYVVCENEC